MVSSTQQAINIAGIKDGIIVMKDGSYRLVLQVAATNFALKSEQEQNSIIFQYQSFLNSLHFPIEIVVSSRRLDLSSYITKIEKTMETQTSDLMRLQTTDYIDFLKKLIEMANIMKKTFYVVIPYTPVTMKKPGFLTSLFGGGSKSMFEHVKVSAEDFKTYGDKLREEAGTIATGLGAMGLHCFQLSTEQLIELFYLLYNPDEAAKEIVKDATQLSSPVIMNEDEFKNNGVIVPSDQQMEQVEKNENMIDNSSVVEQKHKQDAQEIKQANVAAPQATQAAAPAPTPAPAPQPTTPASTTPTQPSTPPPTIPNQSG